MKCSQFWLFRVALGWESGRERARGEPLDRLTENEMSEHVWVNVKAFGKEYAKSVHPKKVEHGRIKRRAIGKYVGGCYSPKDGVWEVEYDDGEIRPTSEKFFCDFESDDEDKEPPRKRPKRQQRKKDDSDYEDEDVADYSLDEDDSDDDDDIAEEEESDEEEEDDEGTEDELPQTPRKSQKAPKAETSQKAPAHNPPLKVEVGAKVRKKFHGFEYDFYHGEVIKIEGKKFKVLWRDGTESGHMLKSATATKMLDDYRVYESAQSAAKAKAAKAAAKTAAREEEAEAEQREAEARAAEARADADAEAEWSDAAADAASGLDELVVVGDDAADVKLVVTQASCCLFEAVSALEANDGNVAAAVVEVLAKRPKASPEPSSKARDAAAIAAPPDDAASAAAAAAREAKTRLAAEREHEKDRAAAIEAEAARVRELRAAKRAAREAAEARAAAASAAPPNQPGDAPPSASEERFAEDFYFHKTDCPFRDRGLFKNAGGEGAYDDEGEWHNWAPAGSPKAKFEKWMGPRIYLQSHYSERMEIKKEGGEFDWDRRQWFVPFCVQQDGQLPKFERWRT